MATKERLTSPLASGWWTSEFGTMAGMIATQLIAFISTLYLINPSMGLSPTEKIAAVGALFAYITGSSSGGLKFIHSRQKVKERAIDRMGSGAVYSETFKPADRLKVGESGWAERGL